VIDKFHYLKLGLSIVLMFIGAKMLVTALHFHIPVTVSLLVVAGVLGGSVVASLIWPKALEEHKEVTHDPLDASDDSGLPPIPPENPRG
jgi:tellurite resistance protein TerC